jgi:GT2 family glycosyltransferase
MPIDPQPAGPALLCGNTPPPGEYDADIIILTLNRPAETIAAVHSALAQQHVSLHVTLLDQGSAPPTRAAFINAFQGLKNFSFYGAERNIGVGGGRNFLSSIGHGRIIVALDNDAIFADNQTVARAVQIFDRQPAMGAIGFKILNATGTALDHYSWGYPRRLKALANSQFNTTTFVGAGHAIRRTAWEDAGGYDSSLFFTWEEYDFCLRAIARAWLVTHQGSIAVRHNLSADSRIGWSGTRMQFYVRNRLLIARKWGRSWPSLAPLMLVFLVRGALNRVFAPALKGMLAAFRASKTLPRAPMPPRMIAYVRQHETAHRGSLFRLFRDSILRPHPADP